MVRNSIADVRFYSLIPAVMRSVNPSTAASFLLEHGDNLSFLATTLQTRYQETFHRMRKVVKDALPVLVDIFTWPTQQSTVYVVEKNLLRATPLSGMSEWEASFSGVDIFDTLPY